MKVLLKSAISPNGLISREDGQEDWLSSAGWDEFLEDAKIHKNIVMGRETYELVAKHYQDYNFDNVDTELKVIISRNFTAPAGYRVVKSPEEAIELAERAGYKTLLLIGGGKLNASFLSKNLVDNIDITVNPYILGKGRPFLWPGDYELKLELLSVNRASEDRVLLSYAVVKNRHLHKVRL